MSNQDSISAMIRPFLCLLAVLAATSNLAVSPARNRLVVTVDFVATPRNEDFATMGAALGTDIYPRIREFFGAAAPQKFRIRFEDHLPSNNVALTEGELIRFNMAWFQETNSATAPWRSPSFDMVLIHEMVHVAQQYSREVPSYWAEGVADYVRYRLGFSNDWSGPQCSAEYPNYQSGYWCAGAFLLFIDQSYGSNCVRRLCRDFKEKRYSDDLFQLATGKSLQELGKEFEKRNVYDLRGSYARTNEVNPITELAQEYMKELIRKGALPGFDKGQRGRLVLQSQSKSAPDKMARFLFYAFKNGSSDRYNYEIVPGPETDGWRIMKAWRSTPDGRVAEWLIMADHH